MPHCLRCYLYLYVHIPCLLPEIGGVHGLSLYRHDRHVIIFRALGNHAGANPFHSLNKTTDPHHFVQADLVAVLVAVTGGQPRILTTQDGRTLPAGPFTAGHRRSWFDVALYAAVLGLLVRALLPMLDPRSRCVLASLSARVGSIGDNALGGWYAYRASKAALNMLLQTAAIETAWQRPLAVIAALQPGTVSSRLSQPFVGDDGLLPDKSARRLLGVIDGLPADGRAHFVDHLGKHIPW